VSLYTYIFFHSGLFSDMGLQVVYLVLSIYGWYQWLRGGENHAPLKVSRASRRVWIIGLALATIVWLALAQYTSTLPGVALPYLDSGLTALSLLAQWMMTRKIVENWALWIVADIIYVPMYISKHLYVTAGLYLVFLVLAILGLIGWWRSYRSEPAGLMAQPA
jgi:nicotinamide mononucleotide transporter